MKFTIFSVLPFVALLLWAKLDGPESDEQSETSLIDMLAFRVSMTGVYVSAVGIFVGMFDLAQQTRTKRDEIEITAAVIMDSVTIVLGGVSVVIGLTSLFLESKWTALDIFTQRGGMLTGLADIAIPLADIVPMGPVKIGLAVGGGISALAEVACLIAEILEKPYIEEITPTGLNVAKSGEVSIAFTKPMDTAYKGQVAIGSLQLTSLVWDEEGRKLVAPYTNLHTDTAYWLKISGFRNRNKMQMEDDRYRLHTVKN